MSNDPTQIDTLIIVCCHAIWVGSSSAAPTTPSPSHLLEENWLISPFQTGETPTFTAHITAGLSTLQHTPNAILIFSGGATKPHLTPLTEGGTYLNYLETHYPSAFKENSARIHAETHARDSFQNVLFSLLLWPKFVRDSYHDNDYSGAKPEVLPSPRRLIVIGHEFKRARFTELHLPALRYPTDGSRFVYVGIDPPFDERKMREVREGDKARGYGAWEGDLYGVGKLLSGKRVERGWTGEEMRRFVEECREGVGGLVGGGNGSSSSNEGVKELFESVLQFVEGSVSRFPEKAPWS